MGVGDEDLAGAQEACRPKGIVVTEVEQEGAFRPSHFDEQTRVAEDVIDEKAGEGGVHGCRITEPRIVSLS